MKPFSNQIPFVIAILLMAPCTSLSDTGRKLRGSSTTTLAELEIQSQRVLPKKKGSSSSSSGGGGGDGGSHYDHGHSYYGCLEYSSEALKKIYGYSGDCSYTVTDGNDNGNGNDGGYDDDGESGYVDDAAQYDDGAGDDTYGYSDDGNYVDASEGAGNDNGDYSVIVNNEDFINGTDYDPYDDFDVTQCTSYDNLWTWDLAISCEDTKSLSTCNCSFAEELISLGLLTCDDESSCPEDCPICATCLSIIGCNVTDVPDYKFPDDSLSATTILYIVSGALSFLILICFAFRCCRRRSDKDDDDMKMDLMAGEVIKNAPGAYQDDGNNTSPTWEPPSLDTSDSVDSTSFEGAVNADAVAHEELNAVDWDNNTVPTVDDTVNTGITSPTPILFQPANVPILEDNNENGSQAEIEISEEDSEDLSELRPNPFKEEQTEEESPVKETNKDDAPSWEVCSPEPSSSNENENYNDISEESIDEMKTNSSSTNKADDDDMGTAEHISTAEENPEESDAVGGNGDENQVEDGQHLTQLEKDLLQEAETELAKPIGLPASIYDGVADDILTDTGDVNSSS